jgi:hypothetical protein
MIFACTVLAVAPSADALLSSGDALGFGQDLFGDAAYEAGQPSKRDLSAGLVATDSVEPQQKSLRRRSHLDRREAQWIRGSRQLVYREIHNHLRSGEALGKEGPAGSSGCRPTLRSSPIRRISEVTSQAAWF